MPVQHDLHPEIFHGIALLLAFEGLRLALQPITSAWRPRCLNCRL